MKRILPLLALLPTAALAHPGQGGFLHPFTGADHLAAVLGVDPEPAILASVILLGAVLALGLRLPLAVALPMLAGFGLAHGAAHAAEGAFGPGMLAATALLQGLGLLLGRLLNRSALRGLGAAGAVLALALGA